MAWPARAIGQEAMGLERATTPLVKGRGHDQSPRVWVSFPLGGLRAERGARFPSADRLTEHTIYLYVTPLRPE